MSAFSRAYYEAALLWTMEEWFADYEAVPICIKQSIVECGPFAKLLKPIAEQAATTPAAQRFDAMKALLAGRGESNDDGA